MPLVTALSVSAAFGADPTSDGPRGQSVAAFVHELIFGPDEDYTGFSSGMKYGFGRKRTSYTRSACDGRP